MFFSLCFLFLFLPTAAKAKKIADEKAAAQKAAADKKAQEEKAIAAKKATAQEKAVAAAKITQTERKNPNAVYFEDLFEYIDPATVVDTKKSKKQIQKKHSSYNRKKNHSKIYKTRAWH